MIKNNISRRRSKLRVNKSTEGETIEQKCERIESNKEPITDGAPIIYTERGSGVAPEYDIRTDRFEVALDAMDTVSKAETAKRKSYTEVKDKDKDDKKSPGGEPIQGTETQTSTESK